MTPNEEYRSFQPKYSQYEANHGVVGACNLDNEEVHLQMAITGVAAEAGELLAHVQKSRRKVVPMDRDKVFDELSDVLWYTTYTLRVLGRTMEELMVYNKDKLDRRNSPNGTTV